MNVHPDRADNIRGAETRRISLCTMASLLLITGCAGSMGTMHVDPPPPPVTSFDGVYQNTIRSTTSAKDTQGTSWCETPGQPTITIANGQFSYAVSHPNAPGNPTPAHQATMASDGSFFGQNNDGTISGTVHGTHIEGSIDGAACGYAFTGDRM